MHTGDIEVDNEGDDEKQDARRQDNGALEKHKRNILSIEELLFNYFQNARPCPIRGQPLREMVLS
jgi:hypothetical protein